MLLFIKSLLRFSFLMLTKTNFSQYYQNSFCQCQQENLTKFFFDSINQNHLKIINIDIFLIINCIW